MAYYVDIVSPETYQISTDNEEHICGYRERWTKRVQKLEPGDKLLVYLTRLSRWVGMLEVKGTFFIDETPRYQQQDDPYIVRIPTERLIWFTPEQGIPIREPMLFEHLSFTKGKEPYSGHWTIAVRSALSSLSDEDGSLIENALREQASDPKVFPLSEKDERHLEVHRLHSSDGLRTISIPDRDDKEGTTQDPEGAETPATEERESYEIQRLLAQIGEAMGFKVWLPNGDQNNILKHWTPKEGVLLRELPLHYDNSTMKTVSNIDVLWINKRSIVRAFEVEHTTSIYSGLLRMADLVALQPNIQVDLHIVADISRQDKVLEEIRRPVFASLEPKPLAELCTYLSYDAIRELANDPHLKHLSDTILAEHEVDASDH